MKRSALTLALLPAALTLPACSNPDNQPSEEVTLISRPPHGTTKRLRAGNRVDLNTLKHGDNVAVRKA